MTLSHWPNIVKPLSHDKEFLDLLRREFGHVFLWLHHLFTCCYSCTTLSLDFPLYIYTPTILLLLKVCFYCLYVLPVPTSTLHPLYVLDLSPHIIFVYIHHISHHTCHICCIYHLLFIVLLFLCHHLWSLHIPSSTLRPLQSFKAFMYSVECFAPIAKPSEPFRSISLCSYILSLHPSVLILCGFVCVVDIWDPLSLDLSVRRQRGFPPSASTSHTPHISVFVIILCMAIVRV